MHNSFVNREIAKYNKDYFIKKNAKVKTLDKKNRLKEHEFGDKNKNINTRTIITIILKNFSVNTGIYLYREFGVQNGVCAGLSFLWEICIQKSYSKNSRISLTKLFSLENINNSDPNKKNQNGKNVLKEIELDYKENIININWFYKTIDNLINKKRGANEEKFVHYVKNLYELVNHNIIINDIAVIEYQKEPLSNFLGQILKFKDDLCITLFTLNHAMALYISTIDERYFIYFYDPNTREGQFSFSIQKNQKKLVNKIEKQLNIMLANSNYFYSNHPKYLYFILHKSSDFINKTKDENELLEKPRYFGIKDAQKASYILCTDGAVLSYNFYRYIVSKIPGINPNLKVDTRGPILNSLISKGDKTKIELLLRHPDIDPNLPSKSGLKPIDLAIIYYRDFGKDIIMLLLAHPKINYSDRIPSLKNLGITESEMKSQNPNLSSAPYKFAPTIIIPDNLKMKKNIENTKIKTEIIALPVTNFQYITPKFIPVTTSPPTTAHSPYLADKTKIFNPTSKFNTITIVKTTTLEKELFKAIFTNNPLKVKSVLQQGANINHIYYNKEETTPLFWAAYKNRLDILKILLANPKIDVNLADNHNTTPLYQASQDGYFEIVRTLLNVHGIIVNKQVKNGSTPLFIAAYNNHLEIIKLLISANASPHIKNNLGMTPRDASIKNRNTIISDLILKHELKFNAKNNTVIPISLPVSKPIIIEPKENIANIGAIEAPVFRSPILTLNLKNLNITNKNTNKNDINKSKIENDNLINFLKIDIKNNTIKKLLVQKTINTIQYCLNIDNFLSNKTSNYLEERWNNIFKNKSGKKHIEFIKSLSLGSQEEKQSINKKVIYNGILEKCRSIKQLEAILELPLTFEIFGISLLNNIKFNDYSHFRKAKLNDIDFENVDLSHANLEGLIFDGANFIKANLSFARLSSTSFANANLEETNFEYATLRNANLRKSKLNFTKLKDADLYETNFWGAIISNTNLCESNYGYSSLTKYNLNKFRVEEICAKAKKWYSKHSLLDDAKAYCLNVSIPVKLKIEDLKESVYYRFVLLINGQFIFGYENYDTVTINGKNRFITKEGYFVCSHALLADGQIVISAGILKYDRTRGIFTEIRNKTGHYRVDNFALDIAILVLNYYYPEKCRFMNVTYEVPMPFI